MIFEKIDRKININLLKNTVTEATQNYLPFMVSSCFGGWSVTSASGSYRDGWQSGELLYSDAYKNSLDKEKFRKNLGFLKSTEHINKTEICKGYLNEVVNDLIEDSFEPCRIRLSLLKAGGQSTWHRDAEENQYTVRLHIPIFTNTNCFFESEGDRVHLKADGSIYIIKVNKLHRVINCGTEDRLHLIMNITQKKQFTKQLQLK